MPYEKGGRADKKGNKYEINCIVYELLKVLDGSNYSVVIEALGEDEKGTDILVTNHEGKKEHQQCKARNGSSDNWTISDLKARKIFNAWKIQLDRECDRKVALVSPMTCSFLVDLNDRANNTSGKADEFYDFQIMNSSKEFQSFYENFCKEMNIEIGRESGILKSIDYLKRIYYKQISEYEIQELITQNIQYQFSSPKDMVYDAFVSMIVSKDILGRELTQIALIDYIEKKNIKFQLREDDGRIGFRIKELNQEYRESFRTLQEGLIHRKEFDNCIKYIMDGKGVVITGNAGYGKSGCTEAILNFCEDANIPCIAIKLDRRIPHKNCKNWGEELGLPGSIAYCIHTISRNENAIIILDQLDALRWTQSNSSEALSICMELIRQVECFQLFGKCYKKYVEYTALEDRMVITATGKIHKENCRYIKDTPVKVLLMKPKSAVFKGFTVCKFCGTKDIWNRLEWKCETVKKQNRKHYNEMQYLPLTEKNIGAICKHFQVSYSIGEKVVFVRTSFTSWIVCLDGNAVSKLFHENYKPCKNEYSKRSKLKGIEGYHVQKMPSSNFYRVICYIKKHDDSLIKQWGKRNRIEKIFDQIEEELEKTKNQIS